MTQKVNLSLCLTAQYLNDSNKSPIEIVKPMTEADSL